VVCDAFGAACKELQVSIEIKLIVLKLFERKVVDSLDAVYVEANRVLVDAGILPQLRYVVPKGFRGSAGTGPGGQGGQPGQDGGGEGGMPGGAGMQGMQGMQGMAACPEASSARTSSSFPRSSRHIARRSTR
jgi:hypothetical protein